VKLKNSKKDMLELTTKEDGQFEFPVDYDENYTVEGTKESYSRDIEEFNTIDYFPTDDFFVKLEIKKQERVFQLIVKVIDRDTKKPLEKAAIAIDGTNKTLGVTNKKGIWMQPLERDLEVAFIVTKNGYDPKVVSLSNIGQKVEKDFEVVVELKKGADVGKYARWYKIIYYDFDKSNIRPDAVPVMMEVLQFVRDHPEVRLLMNSYCDSRGSNAYNEKLSKRRAEAATQWLGNNGVDKSVVEKMEWGGETMLMNKCADGSICTEDDHQKNRRTEIRVIRVAKNMTSDRN
jgi:outer membrane protein OmpA-like peptidoglycan-associated protein